MYSNREASCPGIWAPRGYSGVTGAIDLQTSRKTQMLFKPKAPLILISSTKGGWSLNLLVTTKNLHCYSTHRTQTI